MKIGLEYHMRTEIYACIQIQGIISRKKRTIFSEEREENLENIENTDAQLNGKV